MTVDEFRLFAKKKVTQHLSSRRNHQMHFLINMHIKMI